MEFSNQSWNFLISHGILPILYQICISIVTTKKLRSDLESPHCPNVNSRRETVMENQEMVMETLWESFFFKSVGTLK